MLFADHVNIGDCANGVPIQSSITDISQRKVFAFAAIIFLALGGISSAAPSPSPDSSEADKLDRQVYALLEAGKYSEAVPFATQSLHLREKALGPEHLDTIVSLNNLAVLYLYMGEYAKAEPLFQRTLKIREKVLGPEHPDTAGSLNNLAALYTNLGDYAKAEPLLKRALKIREKALGSQHTDTANSLNSLAELYRRMGAYASAEPLYQRALKIDEAALGPNDPGTAVGLNNLALLYVTSGDYAKAEPLYQRALKINEKALGPEHPTTSISLNNLAELYRVMADYGKAEPLYQRSLSIREKVLGPEHPATATVLDNLAATYKEMGDYAKAEPLNQRALKIYEQALGPEHPETATCLKNLALLYRNMGDYTKAEPLLQRALGMCEKVLGPNHPDTANSLDNLAGLYFELRDYAKAVPLFQRALKINEKVLGPGHSSTAVSLNNLGVIYRAMGDYAKAETFSQRALRIREKSLGPEHPDTAQSLNNLAQTYYVMGEYAKATPLFERALDIRKKALGSEHPDTAVSLSDLALVYMNLGDSKGASHLAAEARRAQEKTLANILSFTSEQQRLAFQAATNPYELLATLGSASELAEIVLRQKGVVLDSLLEDRLVAKASKDPRQQKAVTELRGAKQRLMQLQLEAPKDISETGLKKRGFESKQLSQRVEQLEAGLARQVAGLGHARRALSVTVPQVQAAIGKHEALIELLRYVYCVGKFEARYGAIIIASSGEPKWVQLGSATEIENNIVLCQKSARGKTDEATLSNVLRALHTQIWAPIEKALPAGTTTAIVSPDAELSFVSFATLLTPDDHFVGEKYSVCYVASGRDLLRQTKVSGNQQTTVYADPDFGSKPASPDSNRGTAVALRSIEMRDLQSISLPPLPGTAAEAAALEKRSGKSAKVFLGPNATEAELRQANSPHILHLATHGFFLPEIDLGTPSNGLSPNAAEIPKGKLVNPMHRSGLAMAGAQTTLQAWGRGEVPPTESDGIVTAEEVGGLKLEGTWLVVLSACDTGGGEAKAGEGVMGLRRGFIQAGARNLLMTLWPISDQTTVQIMLDFYDAAFKSGNAPQALADAQRDWLVKLRKERGLLPAVRLAGPFIMSSQGKP